MRRESSDRRTPEDPVERRDFINGLIVCALVLIVACGLAMGVVLALLDLKA